MNTDRKFEGSKKEDSKEEGGSGTDLVVKAE